jgi:hypothetical protein
MDGEGVVVGGNGVRVGFRVGGMGVVIGSVCVNVAVTVVLVVGGEVRGALSQATTRHIKTIQRTRRIRFMIITS